MESSKLYVGNLNYATTEDDLKEAFAPFGTIKDVIVIPRKGFGFVEMTTPEEAVKAKEALNQTEMAGRTLNIDEARPPQEKETKFRNF